MALLHLAEISSVSIMDAVQVRLVGLMNCPVCGCGDTRPIVTDKTLTHSSLGSLCKLKLMIDAKAIPNSIM